MDETQLDANVLEPHTNGATAPQCVQDKIAEEHAKHEYDLAMIDSRHDFTNQAKGFMTLCVYTSKIDNRCWFDGKTELLDPVEPPIYSTFIARQVGQADLTMVARQRTCIVAKHMNQQTSISVCARSFNRQESKLAEKPHWCHIGQRRLATATTSVTCATTT